MLVMRHNLAEKCVVDASQYGTLDRGEEMVWIIHQWGQRDITAHPRGGELEVGIGFNGHKNKAIDARQSDLIKRTEHEILAVTEKVCNAFQSLLSTPTVSS